MKAPVPKMLTVTDINSIARDLLENTFMPIWITAEIGTLICARSGHVYMTLKDNKSQVRAVMFGGVKLMNELGLGVGAAVEVFGQLTLYVPGGEFQFKVQSIRPNGLGNLQQQFEEIKKRLHEEGLFDTERKRRLPEFPRCIGVITSQDGAALHDFIQIVTRRFPPVHLRIYPCQVQGKGAAESVVRGVRFFNRMSDACRPDVLVLTRGGGSIEDLWCFNEESLARTIAESEIPTVSAIGHEVDFTIADFAADVRAPTPSAAAELVIQPYESFTDRINQNEKDLAMCAELFLRRCENDRKQLEMRLNRFHPMNLIRQHQQQTDQMESQLLRALNNRIVNEKHRLNILELRLSGANPDTVLNRGYAYLRNVDGGVVGSVTQTAPGDAVTAVLRDGTLDLTVRNIVPHPSKIPQKS